ncbi:hypothetical protein, partial [Bacillus sp. V33-4]|uniref:hypothetical protein n=1 Tax=Bacillus sp. V33-4 TaxID=2054169 RepID=UPI001C60A450
LSADGSWGFPPVRVGRRQAHTKEQPMMVVLFLFSLDTEKPSDTPFRLINYDYRLIPGFSA